MRTGSPAPRRPRAAQLQGPIALERALFCLGCEAIFTGVSRCPQCTGETVWPLTAFLFSWLSWQLSGYAPPGHHRPGGHLDGGPWPRRA